MRKRIDQQQELGQWQKAPGNINLEYWASSSPINYFEQGAGLYDVIGNVWQWTETPIHAYSGFRTHKCYDDFSLPTFDNKHNMIKGGSWIATGNEALTKSRYAFRRHFFQHAGFRYIVSNQAVRIQQSIYESDDLASQYLEFHFGVTDYYNVPNFMKQVVERIAERIEGNLPVDRRNKALDLGCAVGRGTFELAKHFKFVTGLDFSANFVLIGAQMQKLVEMKYKIASEGSLREDRVASLQQLGLQNTVDRVEFFQADACNLNYKWSNYDLVLAANLIDRLYKPTLFLGNIHKHMNKGGILVITSPYTWLEQYTAKEQWLGGYIDEETKQPVTTLDGLKKELSAHFEICGEPIDVPFVIRETKRKYQHTIAQMSVWKYTK